MSRMYIPLEDVRVASPCHADWEMMDGNERVKLCGSCRKNVYNLSEMTRFDAEELIAQHEGNLCVRYYQRADGTILTQDCPIGLAKVRRGVLMPLRWAVAGVASVAAWGFLSSRAVTGNMVVSPKAAPAPPQHFPTAKKSPPSHPHAVPRSTPARSPEVDLSGLTMGEMAVMPVQGTPLPFNASQATNKRLANAQRARAMLQHLVRWRKAADAAKK